MAYEPTVIKPPDPSAASTGPPAGAQASAAETAPTTPQPSQPLPPSPGGWGQGAGSGYSSAGPLRALRVRPGPRRDPRAGHPISPPGTTSPPGPARRHRRVPAPATRHRQAMPRRPGQARHRSSSHRPGPAPSTRRPGRGGPVSGGRPPSRRWRSSARRPGRARSCSCTRVIPGRPVRAGPRARIRRPGQRPGRPRRRSRPRRCRSSTPSTSRPPGRCPAGSG